MKPAKKKGKNTERYQYFLLTGEAIYLLWPRPALYANTYGEAQQATSCLGGLSFVICGTSGIAANGTVLGLNSLRWIIPHPPS